jgi:hypothetical protein
LDGASEARLARAFGINWQGGQHRLDAEESEHNGAHQEGRKPAERLCGQLAGGHRIRHGGNADDQQREDQRHDRHLQAAQPEFADGFSRRDQACRDGAAALDGRADGEAQHKRDQHPEGE